MATLTNFPTTEDWISLQGISMHNQSYFMNSLCHMSNDSYKWTEMDSSYGQTDFINSSNVNCSTVVDEWTSKALPREMTFNSDNLVSVISYSVLFVISAISNLTVFITLFRNRRRHRKSRVNLFIMHLCIADLLVTFVMLPMETAWHITVAWLAGDAACRIFMFLRTFGFYLSSFILVTISLDRYFAILKPLSLNDADRRGKIMIVFAWLFSIVASLPQSVIFHVEYHPMYSEFAQCVTFNFFPTQTHELAYNLFSILSIYFIPLIIIVVSYSLILWEISKKTSESKKSSNTKNGKLPNKDYLRRSGMGKIQRAKIRTLRMTIVIVAVFVLCWSPYYIMSIWWWVDRSSAGQVDPKIQRSLFIFAVSNSCMDPIVYGMFTIDFKGEFLRCCCLFKHNPREDITYSYSGLTRRYAVNNNASESGSDQVVKTNSMTVNKYRKNSVGAVKKRPLVVIDSSEFSLIRPQKRVNQTSKSIGYHKRNHHVLDQHEYIKGKSENSSL